MSRHHLDGTGTPRHLQGVRFAPKTPETERRALKVAHDFQFPDASELAIFDEIPVKDQGQVGRCTGMAQSVIKSALYLQVTKKLVIFSAEFSYDMTRIETGVPLSEDSGCVISDVMTGDLARGVCREEVWPTGDTYDTEPGEEAKKDALLYRGLLFNHAPDLFTIRAAIAQGFPVSIGFTVFESFMSEETAKTGIALPPEPGERSLGGHDVTVTGYDMKLKHGTVLGYLKCRNSWSRGWGMKGDFLLPVEYVTKGWASDAEVLRWEMT